MRRLALVLLVAGCCLATTITVTALAGDGHRRQLGHGQVRFDGHGPEWWAARYRQQRQATIKLRRLLLTKPQVVEAINLTCATYGYCQTLWRKARCETGGSFSPRAYNRSSAASGLFQFLPSTWASTPFGRFSIWSPYANALAAGWMHEHGRGGEWACR